MLRLKDFTSNIKILANTHALTGFKLTYKYFTSVFLCFLVVVLFSFYTDYLVEPASKLLACQPVGQIILAKRASNVK